MGAAVEVFCGGDGDLRGSGAVPAGEDDQRPVVAAVGCLRGGGGRPADQGGRAGPVGRVGRQHYKTIGGVRAAVPGRRPVVAGRDRTRRAAVTGPSRPGVRVIGAASSTTRASRADRAGRDPIGGTSGQRSRRMTWLVTGGAGYIGSHVVRAFGEAGMDCVVIDDLSSGHREFVDPRGAVLRRQHSRPRLARPHPHRAPGRRCGASGRVQVRRGVGQPPAAHLHPERHRDGHPARGDGGGEGRTSSSSRPRRRCSAPRTGLVTEQSPTRPESPYGESKLIGEWLLADQAKATAPETHLAALLQRGRLRLSGPARHLPTQPVPAGLRPARRGKVPFINGNTYPTPDGTCVRDYVHVADLALAHVAAARLWPTA